MVPGSQIAGKYRILHKIGEGGMGSVWAARNEVTERDFAIKFLNPGVANADVTRRFLQEAKVAGRLRHPSILEIFDAGPGTDAEPPYLVMELLDGIGLDDAVARVGRLPLGLSLEIMSEICHALALAHRQGIIHRDLKPSNVFLHRIGTGALVPKVLDFGISKVLGEGPGTGVTRTGAVMGSPLYMSPEQAAGDKSIDARSDVHSLGVMLWECLVGQPTFLAETWGLLVVEIINDHRPRLADVLPGTPQIVCDIVDRAIARQRDQRYRDAAELADALDAALAQLQHQPLLSTKSGDAAFFALLEGKSAMPAVRSSTTGAVELPRASGSAQAASGERGVQSVVVPVKKSRGAWLAAVGLLVLGGVAVTGWMLRSRVGSQPAGEPSAEPAAPATSVAPVATESASPAPSASAVPVAPVASSAAPPPVAVPPTPHVAAKHRFLPAKPHHTKPPPHATAAPKSTGAAVNHGITSSGL